MTTRACSSVVYTTAWSSTTMTWLAGGFRRIGASARLALEMWMTATAEAADLGTGRDGRRGGLCVAVGPADHVFQLVDRPGQDRAEFLAEPADIGEHAAHDRVQLGRGTVGGCSPSGALDQAA